jgi:hypothetical protein
MVLEVGDKDDGGSYNRDDVTLLSSLGRSLSSVLEHVESNERAASQASHLLSSSGATNSPQAACMYTCIQAFTNAQICTCVHTYVYFRLLNIQTRCQHGQLWLRKPVSVSLPHL